MIVNRQKQIRSIESKESLKPLQNKNKKPAHIRTKTPDSQSNPSLLIQKIILFSPHKTSTNSTTQNISKLSTSASPKPDRQQIKDRSYPLHIRTQKYVHSFPQQYFTQNHPAAYSTFINTFSQKSNITSQANHKMKSNSQHSSNTLNTSSKHVSLNHNPLSSNNPTVIVGNLGSSPSIIDEDIMNYETLINKLSKGNINDKAIAIKKLIFLYQHSRARIYLYERRIVESLQLSLLIEEKQVSLSALTLLQKILTNASTQSEITSIFRKKLLSKVILNLGSVDINVRKISHKCIHQFIRKFKDYDSVISNYLKTALKPQQQSSTKHLKLKSINSIHSLLMAQNKFFRPDQDYALQLIEELIASSYQKEFVEIRRASLICLICVLKISGSQNTLKQISMKTQNQLYQLRMQSQQLAALLQMIMKFHNSKQQQMQESVSQQDQYCSSSQNAPSPKFISIQQSQVLIQKPSAASITNDKISLITPMHFSEHTSLNEPQPQAHQLKIFNQVSYAEQFLKRLQKLSFSSFSSESLQEIKMFAPFLEKYLVDESIKLFSISKKIVEVIFDSMEQFTDRESVSRNRQQENNVILKKQTNSNLNTRKQVYVIVVPCVVKGIGNKRFIVRKNLDKLVRTYAKNHPDIWIDNFLQRFVKTQNIKIKEMLIDLFNYAYKTSPEFFYAVEKPFQIFDVEISNKNSSLKWKVVECVILMLERQGRQNQVQEMLQKFSIQSYNKIMRKLNKNTLTIQITTNSGQQKSSQMPTFNVLDIDIPSPVSAYKRKFRRNQRITTDQPEKIISLQKEDDTSRNISEQKKINLNKGLFFKQKRNRKSYIDYDLKNRRKTQKRSVQSKQRTSLQRLPELRIKHPISNHSLSKNQLAISISPQSPVKKSFTQKNIMYIQKQNLECLQDPKLQLEKALMTIKNTSSSWMSQFDSINKIRAVVQNHPNIISEEHLQSIVNDLINCLNGNLRSGVMKISLICLDQILLKLKKRLYPYTEMIIHTILKKSVSTSQFMADELKKCICICAEELCTSKVISYINSLLKQSKNTEIKLNVLLIIQTMAKVQKMYKKDAQWIWMTLIDIHDQPQFQLRMECKNIVKIILEMYKSSWKNDVSSFKKYNLQKIDKILKNLNQKGENSWLQQENIEFQKILFSKGISSKYFALQFAKFEQTDRSHLSKKNWKDRIKLINDTFSLALEYSSEFQMNLNIKKYMNILCQHLDQKNPGLIVNGLNIMIKCVQVFSNNQIIQEIMGSIFEKYMLVLETKRGELISIFQKLISKIYQKHDINKTLKQLIKISLSNSVKTKTQAINQMLVILKQQDCFKKEEKIIPCNEKEKEKQKLKNKENTIKQILIQTPNVLNSNVKLTYNGSQTPSAASSGINIQNPCLSINSQNAIPISLSLIQMQKRKFSASSLNMLIKMINKLSSDKLYENSSILNNRLKDLAVLCNKRFGNQFGGKINLAFGGQKVSDFLE